MWDMDTYIKEISSDILNIISTQPTTYGEMISFLNGPTHEQKTKIKIDIIDEVLDSLSDSGYEIHSKTYDDGTEVFFNVPYNTTNLSNSKFPVSFGLISDTHWGEKKCATDSLQKYYDEINKRHISTVFHCGDLITGKGMYKGQREDNHIQSIKEQCKNFVKYYPKMNPGGQTVTISGNHDLTLYKSDNKSNRHRLDAGALIESMAFEKGREDLIYIGQCAARVVIDRFGTVLKLSHLFDKPDLVFSNQSYDDYIYIKNSAKSPEIIAEGHRHKSYYKLEKTKSGILYKLGCGTFLKPSYDYLKHDLYTPVSGWIVNIKYDKNGIKRLIPEPIIFD